MPRVKRVEPRKISNSVFDTMANNFTNKAAYVFSTESSYFAFKDYADTVAENYVTSSMSLDLKVAYNSDIELIERQKVINLEEKIIATKLCDILGFTGSGDPRSIFKTEFKKYINNEEGKLDKKTQDLIATDAQNIAYEQVGYLAAAEVASNPNIIPRKKTQFDNMQKFYKDAGSEEAIRSARKQIEKSKIGNGFILYDNVKNAENLLKGSQGIMEYVSKGKGVIQEIRIGEILGRFINNNLPEIDGKIQKVRVDPLGNSNSPQATMARAKASAMSRLQTGSRTSGAVGKTSTTDLLITIPGPDNEKVKLNIDVKSSITNRYIKHSFKFNMDDLSKVSVPNKHIFNLAILAIIMNANISGKINQFSSLDKAARPLMASILGHPTFINSFLPPKKEIIAEDFQHIIVLNNDLFWYSELIGSIGDNASKFDKNPFYTYAIKLANYQNLGSVVQKQRATLYNTKLNTLHRLVDDYRKTPYEDRFTILMSDPNVTQILDLYRQAALSLSFNVSLKFSIKDLL